MTHATSLHFTSGFLTSLTRQPETTLAKKVAAVALAALVSIASFYLLEPATAIFCSLLSAIGAVWYCLDTHSQTRSPPPPANPNATQPSQTIVILPPAAAVSQQTPRQGKIASKKASPIHAPAPTATTPRQNAWVKASHEAAASGGPSAPRITPTPFPPFPNGFPQDPPKRATEPFPAPPPNTEANFPPLSSARATVGDPITGRRTEPPPTPGFWEGLFPGGDVRTTVGRRR